MPPIDPAVDAAIAGVECPDCRGHLLTAQGMFEAAVKQGAVIEGYRTEIAQLRERLAEAERERDAAKSSISGVVSGFRSRLGDLIRRIGPARRPEDIKACLEEINSSYKSWGEWSAETRLATCLESLHVIRSHLLCGGTVEQAVAELDAILGKVGG